MLYNDFEHQICKQFMSSTHDETGHKNIKDENVSAS